MQTKLARDTIDFLHKHIDSDAAIRLQLQEDELKPVLTLLRSYRLPRTRQMTILGGYMLLQLAVRRHRELDIYDRQMLTRSILDGDYFTGLYYRLLVRYNEHRLLAFLSPVHKRIQIEMIGGKTEQEVMADLAGRIRQYLEEYCVKCG